ncbi:oxidoreductase [Diplodia corticola]|uniref:Oxidoreductase n=1 Tax=Diplodia corticola TaxID=236234 RepID=A0A1J9R581_9PEZI|nr:oxidoreductase [Diplodia corticola]OJD36654.1 oxidoreductase [Diplodia corticola]
MGTISLAMPWSPGESAVQALMHLPPDMDNPTASFMTPQAATMLARAPTIAVGALDAQARPWATVWGGEAGFAQPLGNGVFGVRTPVDRRFDPVALAVVDGKSEGELVKEKGVGRMVAGLPIDLVTRKRVKVYGRMVAASLGRRGGGGGGEDGKEEEGSEVKEVGYEGDDDDGAGEMQLVVRVEQSLGNCPKYLNSKTITPATLHPELLSDSPNLTPEARALIAKCDLFFISSTNGTLDMDVNHRGGPTGFVRILPSSSPDSPTTLVYPEYSGNRFYQTLGNLHTTPRAGLCFPDFATGDVLYVTGTTHIHAGKDAAALLPRSNLAVAITITAARLVRRGLPFRGTPAAGVGNAAAEPGNNTSLLGKSPYNPPVRLLAAEGNLLAQSGQGPQAEQELTATLASTQAITPNVARFTFTLSAPTPVAPGQWVALDASGELDTGYSHMRDDDPTSLNDDFVRTFTVTWASGWDDDAANDGVAPIKPSTAFTITIRRHGPVTGLLFTSLSATHNHTPLAPLPIRGFGGGEFRVEPPAANHNNDDNLTPFVAGGVGITPLLAELAASSTALDPTRVALFWTLRRADAALARDVLVRQHPGLARGARVFFTGGGGGDGGDGDDDVDAVVAELRDERAGLVAVVEGRRLEEGDLRAVEAERWYLCAGTALHKAVVGWVAVGRGKEVVAESFNF